MVYLCCHPLWSVCAVIHYGLFVLSSTMVCLCCRPLWSFCAVIHYGLFVLSFTMVYLCCRPLWSFCAVIHYGLSVLSSTMAYLCCHPQWSIHAVIRPNIMAPLKWRAIEALKERVRVDSPATPGRRQRCGCGRCPLCPRPVPG